MTIDLVTRQSLWMRAFYVSAIITFFIYFWFINRLPAWPYFLGVMLFIFFMYYFSNIFYQHHYLEPVHRDLKGYIDASCSVNDQRVQPLRDLNAEYDGLNIPFDEIMNNNW